MIAPYARNGIVHVPLPAHTATEIISRFGQALADHTDDTALALLMAVEGPDDKRDGWTARAAALSQIAATTIRLNPNGARALAAALYRAADDATLHPAPVDDDEPIWRTCGGCKRLRPNVLQTAHGLRCAECNSTHKETR